MKFLDRLSDAYYAGKPLVSNELFDELARRYNYGRLGTSSEREIKHAHRMWSLDKVYPGDSIPFEGGLHTPKLDGAAVGLQYMEGRLVWAGTRGDGIQGQDITDKMSTLVPTTVERTDNFQVTGEVVTRIGKSNIRNYASGALNLKSLEEFKTRELYFFAYDMTPSNMETYLETLEYLSELGGFRTVLDPELDTGEFPTDGTVVRVNDNTRYRELGFTSKHPRGAYALKENKEAVVTTLLDIDWQVGRSGVVSPVAIFEECDVDGAKVTRATLHNWKYINELRLEPGCKIGVIRAGEIIPRVVGRVYD